jgi:Flp pilus assembly protein TadD
MLGAAPVSAQTATTGAFSERPDDALSRNLRSLAANPKSVAALMGAGKAALELGDAQSALTFFARAEEQLPGDGRIKMWIGSALVQLQQPHAALKFFRDATELGVAEIEVARDRGLAFDIAGRPRDAQRDYRLVLQHGRDEEVTRRLALSLAISGEREPALRLLEDQLLVRDRAAERSRAMVLALTGDTAGAARAVGAAMPGPQANAMTSFLARLPSLSPSGRALAVHLGVFPGDGRPAPTGYAASDFAGAVTDAGRPDPAQTLLARRQAPAEPVSTAPRRRPGADEAAPRNPTIFSRPAATRPSAASGSGAGSPTLAWSPNFDIAPGRVQTEAAPAPTEAKPETLAASTPADVPPATGAPEPALVSILAPAPAPRRVAPPRPKPAARAATAAVATAKPPPKKAKPAPPAEPSRIWVQVAGGADRGALPREYARLKAKAPKLLGGRAAWTLPVNATNRLLVGPFASGKEAQAFVNQLKEQKLSGFAWTSAAGQKVEKLPAK